jgi:hypothetical protein
MSHCRCCGQELTDADVKNITLNHMGCAIEWYERQAGTEMTRGRDD